MSANNHHVNTLTSQMRVEQMLPIVDLDPNEADDSYSLTFELETSREEILEQLLPQFAESMITVLLSMLRQLKMLPV